jgi:hypothetical protein
VCLIGTLDYCQARLSAFRAAGVDLPILMPPIGVDGARSVIQAFRRDTSLLPQRQLAAQVRQAQ